MNKSKNITILFILFLISLFFTTSVLSQEPTNQVFSNEYGSPAIDYEKIIYATLFIAVIVVISLALLKKTRFSTAVNQEFIEVIYSHSFSTKDKLLIVNVAQEYLLLSSSSSGIRKLHILNKEYIDSVIANREEIKANDFAKIFVNVLGKNKYA